MELLLIALLIALVAIARPGRTGCPLVHGHHPDRTVAAATCRRRLWWPDAPEPVPRAERFRTLHDLRSTTYA